MKARAVGLFAMLALTAIGMVQAMPRAAAAACAANGETTIWTDNTQTNAAICGAPSRANSAVYAYMGIPYVAQQPNPPLRWTAVSAASWPPPGAPIAATAYGNACMQEIYAWDAALQTGEDCLYLNVWTPSNAINGAENLPVMVFIHGGAFVAGAGSQPLYDGTALAAHGVVVVTLNYRLGALGFLVANTDGSTAEKPAIAGNFGLFDQQTAMSWVQSNINRFGGDPTQITLFGESAGAMSVGLHTFSVSSSEPLFARAIMESNPMAITYQAPSAKVGQGQQFYDTLCSIYKSTNQESSCEYTLAWLQQPTAAQIIQAQQQWKADQPWWQQDLDFIEALLSFGISLPWQPVLTAPNVKPTVSGQPYNGYGGATTVKPIALGVNADEGALFVDMAWLALTTTQQNTYFTKTVYEGALNGKFGYNNANKIMKYYNASSANSTAYWNSTAETIENLTTDYGFACGNLYTANSAINSAQNNGGVQTVYAYQFTQPPFFDFYNYYTNPPTDSTYAPVPACAAANGNVCHGNELPYVFNNLSATGQTPGPDDQALATAMSAAWVAFAKNDLSGTSWVAYQPGPSGTVVQWANPPSAPGTTTLDANANCSSLWFDQVPYK